MRLRLWESITNIWNKFLEWAFVIAILCAVFFIIGKVGNAVNDAIFEEWVGWVYPSSANLLHDIEIGAYRSLEECRAAALDEISDHPEWESPDYECGLNCERDYAIGINICKETLR